MLRVGLVAGWRGSAADRAIGHQAVADSGELACGEAFVPVVGLLGPRGLVVPGQSFTPQCLIDPFRGLDIIEGDVVGDELHHLFAGTAVIHRHFGHLQRVSDAEGRMKREVITDPVAGILDIQDVAHRWPAAGDGDPMPGAGVVKHAAMNRHDSRVDPAPNILHELFGILGGIVLVTDMSEFVAWTTRMGGGEDHAGVFAPELPIPVHEGERVDKQRRLNDRSAGAGARQVRHIGQLAADQIMDTETGVLGIFTQPH